MSERIKVSTSPSESTTIYVKLERSNQPGPVNVEIYPKNKYYSAYWESTRTPSELVTLVENCVTAYEEMQSLGKEPGQLDNEDGNDVYYEGIIVASTKGNEDIQDELPLDRPLSWDIFTEVVNGRQIKFVRINTLFGDFFIEPQSSYPFGVISHMTHTGPLSQVLEESTSDEVTFQDAASLFEEVVKQITG